MIFEMPLVSVQEVHHYEGYQMWQRLLVTFGAKMNIAYLEFDDPIKLASLRLGIGPETPLKEVPFAVP